MGREFENLCCERAPILMGFPSGNMVSIMSAKYIVKELDLPHVGDIVSKMFNPVTVISDGVPSHCCRIYGDKRVIVFTSDCEYENAEVLNEMVKSIYDFAKRHKSEMIICCEGLIEDPTKEERIAQNIKIDIVGDDDTDGEIDTSSDTQDAAVSSKEDLLELLKKVTREHEKMDGQLWFTTNSTGLAEQLKNIGHKPVRNLILKGISAGIISEMSIRHVPVVCLFAPLNKMLQVGARGSISIIHCIDSLLSSIHTGQQGHLVIDTSNLNKTATEIDKAIIEAINKIDIMSGSCPKDRYSNMYM